MDFDGHAVMIATDSASGNIFNDTEGPYVSAVLRRNSMISDKYDTVIASESADTTALFNKIKNSYISGEFYADFAAIRGGELGAYYSSKSIQNYKVLTYSDFSAPYFNRQAMDQITLDGVIYGVMGSLTDDPESYGCLFFNKTLGEEIGVSIDYESVYAHEFTWDKFFSTIAEAKVENGALVTASYDNSGLSRLSLLSTGQTFLSRNDKGDLASSFNNDISQSVIDTLKKLIPYRTDKITVTNTVVDENGEEKTQKETLTDFDIFVKGKSLYSFGTVADMKKIANCGFEWEILPIPKITEGGDYIAAATGSAPVLVLLRSSKSIEINGYILQALGAASYKHIQSEYIKYAMNHYVSSYYSYDMLELIIESPIYDHATMFGGFYSQLKNGTYVTFYNAVKGSSKFSYYINKTKNELQKYLNARN